MADPFGRYSASADRVTIPASALSSQPWWHSHSELSSSSEYLQKDILVGSRSGVGIGAHPEPISNGYSSSWEDPYSIGRRDVIHGSGPGIADILNDRPDSLRKADGISHGGRESNVLFVDGLPTDCSRREVSHLFRSFRGFKEIRLVHKQPRQIADKAKVLCFVEFTNPNHASTALEALQGYKFDYKKPDSPALRIHFAHFPFKLPPDDGQFPSQTPPESAHVPSQPPPTSAHVSSQLSTRLSHDSVPFPSEPPPSSSRFSYQLPHDTDVFPSKQPHDSVHHTSQLPHDRVHSPRADLMQAMKEEYCPRDEIQHMEAEFLALRMKGSDIEGYTQRCHDFATLYPHMTDSPFKRIEMYIAGLVPEIRGMVTASNPTTIHSAVLLAHKLTRQAVETGTVPKKGEESSLFVSKRKWDGGSQSGGNDQQGSNKKANTRKTHQSVTDSAQFGGYLGRHPECDRCGYHHSGKCNKCQKCNRLGHDSKDCKTFLTQNSGEQPKTAKPKIIDCFNCGKEGHFRRRCPDLKKNAEDKNNDNDSGDNFPTQKASEQPKTTKPKIKGCFNCGKEGHFCSDCPDSKKNANDKNNDNGSGDNTKGGHSSLG